MDVIDRVRGEGDGTVSVSYPKDANLGDTPIGSWHGEWCFWREKVFYRPGSSLEHQRDHQFKCDLRAEKRRMKLVNLCVYVSSPSVE